MGVRVNGMLNCTWICFELRALVGLTCCLSSVMYLTPRVRKQIPSFVRISVENFGEISLELHRDFTFVFQFCNIADITRRR